MVSTRVFPPKKICNGSSVDIVTRGAVHIYLTNGVVLVFLFTVDYVRQNRKFQAFHYLAWYCYCCSDNSVGVHVCISLLTVSA